MYEHLSHEGFILHLKNVSYTVHTYTHTQLLEYIHYGHKINCTSLTFDFIAFFHRRILFCEFLTNLFQVVRFT